MSRRVVITGLGAITPIGNSVDDFYAGIKEGRIGLDNISKFDTSDFRVKIAAEVKDFAPTGGLMFIVKVYIQHLQ